MREAALRTFANADIPFDAVVDALRPTRGSARNPLFNVMIGHQDRTGGDPEFLGRPADGELVHTATAKFDLDVVFAEAGAAGEESLELILEYSTDLFDAAGAQALLTRLERVLDQVAADPRRASGRSTC